MRVGTNTDPSPSFRRKACPRPDRGPESIAAGAFCHIQTEPFTMDPDFHRGDGDGARAGGSRPATPSVSRLFPFGLGRDDRRMLPANTRPNRTHPCAPASVTPTVPSPATTSKPASPAASRSGRRPGGAARRRAAGARADASASTTAPACRRRRSGRARRRSASIGIPSTRRFARSGAAPGTTPTRASARGCHPGRARRSRLPRTTIRGALRPGW